MTDTEKAEMQRLKELLDAVTTARNIAERERDAALDELQTANVVLESASRLLSSAASGRDAARALNLKLTRDLNAALARVDALEARQLALPPGLSDRLKGKPLDGEPIQFSPVTTHGPSKSSEGSDGKPQVPHNAEAGENPITAAELDFCERIDNLLNLGNAQSAFAYPRLARMLRAHSQIQPNQQTQ